MPKIVYIQFTDPTGYPPLEHSALLFEQRGWQVQFLGVQWPGLDSFGFCSQLKAPVHLLSVPKPGWRQKLFFVWFGIWVVIKSMGYRPNWIYISDPLATPVGLLLHSLGFRICYHEHDSPDGPPHTKFEALIRRSRRNLARLARLNVLPQDLRRDIFIAETKTRRPVFRVWNCPRIDEVRDQPRKPRQLDEPLGIYYHGSINLTRLPLNLIKAAGLTGLPIRIKVVGYETGCESSQALSSTEVLRQTAKAYGSSLDLELHGPRSRQELFLETGGMHIGWVAYPNTDADINLQHLAGASNKAFDYLASGLALITNQSSEWLSFFHTAGVAFSCNPNSVDSIMNVLISAYNENVLTQHMGETGRRRIMNDWYYEKQFQPVYSFMKHEDLPR